MATIPNVLMATDWSAAVSQAWAAILTVLFIQTPLNIEKGWEEAETKGLKVTHPPSVSGAPWEFKKGEKQSSRDEKLIAF